MPDTPTPLPDASEQPTPERIEEELRRLQDRLRASGDVLADERREAEARDRGLTAAGDE